MDKVAAALRLTGIGFFIGLSIVAGVGAGLWLDSRLKTAPIFVIIGLLMGIIVAGFGVYRMLLPLLNDDSTRKKEK